VAEPGAIAGGSFSVSGGEASASQSEAAVTDPGTSGGEVLTNYSASIDWGDSSSSAGTITLSAGVFTVRGSHTYAEEGTKPITVTLSHESAANATANSTATISDPAVLPTGGFSLSAVEGAA